MKQKKKMYKIYGQDQLKDFLFCVHLLSDMPTKLKKM